MAEYALQPVGHDPYAQALEPVAHDPWFEPHAHVPLVVPVAPGRAPEAPPAAAEVPGQPQAGMPAPALSGDGLPADLADTWFPPRSASSPFNVPDALSTPTAQRAQERLAAAPLQVGSPGADDAFLQHEPGQPFWPYAQSPEAMSFQQALQAAGGGPEFPAMPAPPAPPAMPTWQDPATVESTVGPQPQDWQKGLEASLRQVAPPGSGLADTASAIPSLIGMTPAGGVADVGQAWNRGDLAGAGLAALGALPGVKAAGKVAKVGEEAAAGLARKLEAKAPAALLPGAATPSLTESLAGKPLLRSEQPFSATLDQAHPAERALTADEILHPDYPAVPARERNVEDIGQQLNDRGQAALRRLGVRGGQIAGPHPVTDELLARNLALETKQALDRGGQTALDWYSKKFEDAMALAAEVHPEIGSDPHAATAYRAALAITSQGETVPSNVRLANVAYDTYKRTGRFPTNLTAKQAPAMNNGFAKMNGIIDAIGPEGATHLLSDMRPAREWQRLGFKISGENADTMLHGSAVLGPKIGGGFYQNLSGNFDPTTFDLWWMRRWNRTTGNLVGLEDLTNQRARLEAELGKARDLAAAGTPNPNLTPRMQAIANQPLPKTMPALIRRAEEIEAEHERHYGSKLTRPLYETGEFEKSDLAKAAIALREGVSGINEAPTGGAQRNWMRAVTARAREILAAHGIHMSNADIQATVWYPEKDLYAKLGGKPSEGLNVDYASAHRNLARERGVPDDRIQSALERSDRGRVRDDVAGGDQGDVGGSQGRGQISGQDDAARTDAGRPAAAPPPNPYVGRSAERNQGDLESDVLALHSAGPASNSALPFHEMNPAKGGSEAFHSAIAAAKAANPHGAAVALYSPDEYRDMRTFLTQDRSAGFALKGDDIVSVFKHPNSPHGKIANSSILPLATAQGGRRLDAFDTNLPSIYADSDFRAVARLPWNDAYAPEGWNYDRMKKYNNGRPDVVFMTHEPHGTPRYEPGDGKQVQSYDKGNAAQEKALKAVDMRAKASTFAGRWRDLSTEEQRQIADEVLQAKEESK